MERVLWPMEPVEPRMASRFKIRKALEHLVNNLSVPQRWSGQQQGVDAVQDAAMAGQQGTGVFDAYGTLERGLGQIAHLRSHIDDRGQHQPEIGRASCR